MTVAELIQALLNMPQDAEVFAEDYTWGPMEINTPRVETVTAESMRGWVHELKREPGTQVVIL